MREADLAAALLSAMISAGPLSSSPAGQALGRLVRSRPGASEQLRRQWEEARRPEPPLSALLRLSDSLARHAETDAGWRAAVEEWLRLHRARAGNAIGGSAQLHGPTVQAGLIEGGVHFHHTDRAEGAGRAAAASPRQLRPAPAHFTNRGEELRALYRITDEGKSEERLTLAVLWGPGGVGKTALALRWLHEAADRYPEGQLYADLASDTTGEPALTGAILHGFLRALGVESEQVPAEVQEAAALFRSITAQSRIAILMENAVSAAQVRALLPSSSSSTVVVTTRWRLGGLAMDGGAFVAVAPFREQAGRELLRRTVGAGRVAAEGEAADGLVGLCAGFPLALSLAGARLVTRPEWPIARVVRELADEQRRLEVLAMEEVSVLSVFDLSYGGLPPEFARAYRRLGIHPGSDFSLRTAAAAVGLSEEATSRLLEGLLDASLLESSGPDRYAFHDLVRLHARQRAEREDGPGARTTVLRSILEHYFALAAEVERVVAPLERRLGPAPRRADTAPAFATSAEALDALEGELPNVMAVLRAGHEHRLHEPVWQLAEVLWPFFLHRRHFADWIATYRLAVDAAALCARDDVRSGMHRRLGFALHNLGRGEEALRQGKWSLTAARLAEHGRAEAEALGLVGMAYRALGRVEEAVDVQRQAVDLERRAGRARGEALGRRRLGQALVAAGRIAEAIEEFDQGRELAESLGDAMVSAMTAVWQADALTRAGRPADAVQAVRGAWPALDASGSGQYRAQALMVWGEAAEELRDLETARDLLVRSRACYLDAGAPSLERVVRGLSRVEAKLAGTNAPPSS